MAELTRRGLYLGTLGVALLAANPSPRAHAESPGKAPVDPYALVDPELVAAVRMIRQADLSAQTLAARRSASAHGYILPPPAPQPVERSIAGPAGAPLRVYVTEASPGAKGRPGVLHIHNGGYVTGTALTEAALAQTIARQLGCVVVSVDYTLAPEMKFPGSLDQHFSTGLLSVDAIARYTSPLGFRTVGGFISYSF